MKKTILFLTLLSIYHLAFSEDVIYKCVDKHGNVSYVTDEKDYLDCSKTNLAVIDKLNIFDPNTSTKSNQHSNTSHSFENSQNTVIPSVSPTEQANLDIKRNDLLKQELAKEKLDLNKVQAMIQQSSNNPQQLSSLLALEKTHEFNISQIEHDLGMKIPHAVIPQNNQSSNLSPNTLNENKPKNSPTIFQEKTFSKTQNNLHKKPYLIQKSMISSNNKIDNNMNLSKKTIQNIHISPSNFLLGH